MQKQKVCIKQWNLSENQRCQTPKRNNSFNQKSLENLYKRAQKCGHFTNKSPAVRFIHPAHTYAHTCNGLCLCCRWGWWICALEAAACWCVWQWTSCSAAITQRAHQVLLCVQVYVCVERHIECVWVNDGLSVGIGQVAELVVAILLWPTMAKALPRCRLWLPADPTHDLRQN